MNCPQCGVSIEPGDGKVKQVLECYCCKELVELEPWRAVGALESERDYLKARVDELELGRVESLKAAFIDGYEYGVDHACDLASEARKHSRECWGESDTFAKIRGSHD